MDLNHNHRRNVIQRNENEDAKGSSSHDELVYLLELAEREMRSSSLNNNCDDGRGKSNDWKFLHRCDGTAVVEDSFKTPPQHDGAVSGCSAGSFARGSTGQQQRKISFSPPPYGLNPLVLPNHGQRQNHFAQQERENAAAARISMESPRSFRSLTSSPTSGRMMMSVDVPDYSSASAAAFSVSPEECCAVCYGKLDELESPRVVSSENLRKTGAIGDDDDDGFGDDFDEKENEKRSNNNSGSSSSFVRKKKETYTLPCKHRFHRKCLEDCRANDYSTCPMCREILPGGLTPDHVKQMRAMRQNSDPTYLQRALVVSRAQQAREAVRASALRRQMSAGVYSTSPTNSLTLTTPHQVRPSSAVGDRSASPNALRRTNSSGGTSREGDASTDRKPPLPPRGVPLNSGGDVEYNKHRRNRSDLTAQLAKIAKGGEASEEDDDFDDDFDMSQSSQYDLSQSQSQKSTME